MTSKTRAPTVARWMLARELRRLRGERRPADVVTPLRAQQSSLMRWEDGGPAGQVPGVARLEGLLKVYEVDADETARLMDLREVARTPGWWQGRDVGRAYGTYIGLESAASEVMTLEQTLIPGILQTEDYIRAVMTAAHAPFRAPMEDVDDRVSVRMRRQEDWISRGSPHVWAIVGEGALRTTAGDPAVDREQLGHLLSLAASPNLLTFQVLPFSAGLHAATEVNSFTIMDVPDAGLSTVYLEASDLFMDSESDVTTYRRIFDHLRKAAMNTPDSRKLVTEIMEGLEQ